MLAWPSVACTSCSGAPSSMACEPCACRSQCGEIAALTPALAAVRFTIPCTARAVSRPPLRLANTGSLAPASPRNVSSDRLTMIVSLTWADVLPRENDLVQLSILGKGEKPRQVLLPDTATTVCIGIKLPRYESLLRWCDHDTDPDRG